MKNILNVFKKVPKKALLLALVIAVAVSMVAVAGTFAVFETTVIGLGETPISDWNFDVRINNDGPVDGIVSGITIAGDDEQRIVSGTSYYVHHTRDDDASIASNLVAPGTAGYVPIEVDGSDSSVAMVITVKAEFSYLNGFSFTDNLRRTLAITTESESYSYEDEDSNAVNATYVGYITYSYYVSYEQVSHWADDDYIDIGFRWDWSEDDNTPYEDIPEYVYTRITITGKQITNANQVKSADTAINFIWDNTKTIPQQLQYGNVLNIINVDGYNAGFELTDAEITGDLYLDVNANGFTEPVDAEEPYATMLQGNVVITSSQDVKFVLGTNRTQHGYLYEYIESDDYAANIPYVSIEAPNADAYISNDFIANKVQTANNLVDILNASMERMGESQADTMYEALTYAVNDSTASEALADYNANVNVTDVTTLETIISTQYGNCDVVWDSASNRFAYISSDGTTVVQKDDISTIDLSKKYKLFKTYSAMPATQTYSIYAVSAWTDATITDLAVGLDIGANDEITAITYVGSSAEQDVIIRTGGGTLTINASKGTIRHYGAADYLNIIECATSSYHEYGYIPLAQIAKGRIVNEVYNDDEADGDLAGVQSLFLVAHSDGNKFSEIIVGAAIEAELPALDRTAVTIPEGGILVVKVEEGVTESNIENEDYIYLYKSGINEQILTSNTKVSDGTITGIIGQTVTGTASVGGGTVVFTVGTNSIENDESKDAAIQIANVPTGVVEDYNSSEIEVEEKATTEDVAGGLEDFAGGVGTASNPYLIATAEQFCKINEYNNGYCFKLKEDIQLTDEQILYSTAEQEYYYVGGLTDVVIDGNGKTIKTSKLGTFGGSNPFIIISTAGNFELTNVYVQNGNPIIYSVDGNATFTKVTSIGTSTTGSSNNFSVRYFVYMQGKNQVINFNDCDNYTDILNSGYTAVYIGNLKYADASGNITINMDGCDNYGVIRSTGSGASMILSNANQTYGCTNPAYLNITNCYNYGVISSSKSYANLLMSGLGEPYYGFFNSVYRRGFYINDVAIDYTNSKNKASDMYNAISAGCDGNLAGIPAVKGSYSEIEINEDCFVLNSVENATIYKLQFSFAAHGQPYNGGNVNYTLTFDTTLPSDIKVGNWINKKDATEEIITHNEYGVTYYTSGDSYVFYTDTGYISSYRTPLATFIAYDADGNILSVQTYRYPEE